MQKQIVKGKETKALDLFHNICNDFSIYKDELPSRYISMLWKQYSLLGENNNGLNGKVFEYILISLMINKKILPLYVQAKAAFVPNVEFDLLLYTEEKPIVLSAKTSLRERYKQADLEAIALKYVHRKACSYLLTLSEQEAIGINKKIKKGEVIGINEVIYCFCDRFDIFIDELKNDNKFCEAGTIQIIKAATIVKND